jgi:hypothetical protein
MSETVSIKALVRQARARDGERDDSGRLKTERDDGFYQQRERGEAALIFSRLLGEEVWLTESESDARALEAELASEGDTRPVFTVAEVLRLGEMAEADRQAAATALARVKRGMPASRLRAVEGFDA